MFVAQHQGVVGQTFTVDSGATLNVGLTSQGASWVDFDDDSDLDLFVSTGVFDTPKTNPVFKNDGAGLYSLFISSPLTTDLTLTAGQTWGDYNNDGFLDLFLCNHTTTNSLYRNMGSSFDKPPMGHLTSITGFHYAATWGDYDSDGFLDLLVCPRNVTGPVSGVTLLLYHNNGTGGLDQITSGVVATTLKNYSYASWIDCDSDGDLDLFASCGAPVASENDILFRNQLVETDTASFVIQSGSGLTLDGTDGLFPAWADYNNDGIIDLYLTTWDGLSVGTPNMLYRGTGAGTFTRLTTLSVGSVITGAFLSTGATWGDYDNDGDLDLFTTEQTSANNRLHRNNGDETFTDVTALVSITPVAGYTSHAATWGDDDRDGDLDLYVTYAYGPPNSRNRIYRNSGNANHWLEILCEGHEGNNRSGIGAKVRILSTIAGLPTWQFREINSQSGFFSTNLEQHFGLGDATIADSVIVAWPSGFVKVLSNVPSDQRLIITDCIDIDLDGVICSDNCPLIPNAGQEDADNDGIGDACCCIGTRGNVDHDLAESVDIADLTTLVDHLFITFAPIDCPNEGNVDAASGIDIADLTMLVDHLFISFTPIGGC